MKPEELFLLVITVTWKKQTGIFFLAFFDTKTVQSKSFKPAKNW